MDVRSESAEASDLNSLVLTQRFWRSGMVFLGINKHLKLSEKLHRTSDDFGACRRGNKR